MLDHTPVVAIGATLGLSKRTDEQTCSQDSATIADLLNIGRADDFGAGC